MSAAAPVLKERGARNLTLAREFGNGDVLMFINAEMEMPRPHVHGEIAVEHSKFLRRFGQLNLKYRPLNTWAKDDLAPVPLKQFTQEPFEAARKQSNISILSCTTVKVLRSLRLVHTKSPGGGVGTDAPLL